MGNFEYGAYVRANGDLRFEDAFVEDDDGTWNAITWVKVSESDVIRIISHYDKYYICIEVWKKESKLMRFKLKIREVDKAFSRCFEGLGDDDKKLIKVVKKTRKTSVPSVVGSEWA